jgi:hypothetical protein
MNIGLHHRSVDPQLAAVLQTELHGGFDDEVVDGLECALPRLKCSPMVSCCLI